MSTNITFCQFSKVAVCVFLALSWKIGIASADNNAEHKKRLRGVSPSILSTTTFDGQRNLHKSKKKSKTLESKSTKGRKNKTPSEAHPSSTNRMIVRCRPGISDENCLAELSNSGVNLNIIHSLPSLHSFAIQGDDVSAFDNLRAMEINVVPDVPRETLVLEGSIRRYNRQRQHNRQLDDGEESNDGEESSGDGEDDDAGPESIPNGVNLIRANQVWEDYGITGSGVTICVLDSGVEATHPDLEQGVSGYTGPEFDLPWDEDTRGHGTHVSGIIAATDNEFGVVGVAPGATVYMVHVIRNGGRTFSSDILAAIELCRNVQADIISMSLGGDTYSQEEQEAFNSLYEDGIVAVAASGNTRDGRMIFPAAYDNVLSVAASDLNDALADFSTINSHTDIAAPGVDIRSTYINGEYASFTGTSAAAPHVAGVLALLLDYDSSLAPRDLMNAIISSARSSTSPIDPTGIGVCDALSAVQLVEDGLPSFESEEGDEDGCVTMELTLNTDHRGYDTAYRLIQNFQGGDVIWLGFNLDSDEEYTESACLDPWGCYRFDIRDFAGNGIDGEGIYLTYDGFVEYSGGDIGGGWYLLLGNC